MKTLRKVNSVWTYLSRKSKVNLVSGSLLLAAALCLAVLTITALTQVPQPKQPFWGFYEVFNARTGDAVAALILLLPSLALLMEAYLLIEAHPMGWKVSVITTAAFLAAAATNILPTSWAISLAAITGLASILEITNQKRNIIATDSPIMTENLAKIGLTLSAVICIGILVGMIAYIMVRGGAYFNWNFITGKWEYLTAKKVLSGDATGSMGGVSDMIIGSLMLAGMCELVAIPLGLGAAIYLSEYATQNAITDVVRFFIETLAGAPSVIIGLVGAAFFVNQLHWGVSLLSGGLSLAFMTLPWNIRVSEEAMRAVPGSYREAAFALGATPSQTIAKIVLYAAMPGIITGIILGTGAAIGETAVVFFTAGNQATSLPTHLALTGANQGIPSLPVWIYITPEQMQAAVSGKGLTPVQNVAFSGALVLILIFLAICSVGLWARNYLSKKLKGT